MTNRWMPAVALVLAAGAAQAQTGDALLNRYSAALERCDAQYQNGQRRIATMPPGHSNTRRARQSMEDNYRRCRDGAQYHFERAQRDQARRQR